MLQLKVKIISHRQVAKNYFHLAVKFPEIAKTALPGQFVNIRIGAAPLLRRPLSIHCVIGANVELLYEVVGKGTEILSQKKSGEYLDIVGPLGSGFDLGLQGYKVTRSQVLVAGGMGVAPLNFLAEKLREIRNPKSEFRIQVLIGAKTKEQILCEKEFKKLGCDVKISTDDGSRGFKGRVTELLKNILLPTPDSQLPAVTIYACGPHPMLKEVAAISKKYNLAAQVSLEAHMACGIGACLGCAVNTKKGYQRVCKEGPVFNAEEIIW